MVKTTVTGVITREAKTRGTVMTRRIMTQRGTTTEGRTALVMTWGSVALVVTGVTVLTGEIGAAITTDKRLAVR